MIPTRASLRLHVHRFFFCFFFFSFLFTSEEEQITDNGTIAVRYRLWPKAKRKKKKRKEYFYCPSAPADELFWFRRFGKDCPDLFQGTFLLLEKCQGNPCRNVGTKTTHLLVMRERIKIKRWPSKNTVNHWEKKKFQQLPFHIEKFPCRKVHTLQPHSRKLRWFSGSQVEMSCCTTFWPENWKIWLRNWSEIKLCCWSSECSSMQLCAVGFVRKLRSSWYGPFFFGKYTSSSE